jgi:pimeloyl-ACP methyl ester carboxylesterase
MRIVPALFTLFLTAAAFAADPPDAGTLLNLELETTLVPSPTAVDVLLPPGYDDFTEPIPHLLWLHGGSSGRNHLERRMRPYIERAWQSGDLTPCVVVTPVTGSSYYMDWHDGTNQWETFIAEQLLTHIRQQFNVREDRAGTVIGGASAGGQGTLRIALRRPELFAAAAAMEPGFPPVLTFVDWDTSRFGPNILPVLHARFGNPVDKDFWHGIHPPTIVMNNAQRLRDSGQ